MIETYAVSVCYKGTLSLKRWEVVIEWTPERAIEKLNLKSDEEAWVYKIVDNPVVKPAWVSPRED